MKALGKTVRASCRQLRVAVSFLSRTRAGRETRRQISDRHDGPRVQPWGYATAFARDCALEALCAGDARLAVAGDCLRNRRPIAWRSLARKADCRTGGRAEYPASAFTQGAMRGPVHCTQPGLDCGAQQAEVVTCMQTRRLDIGPALMPRLCVRGYLYLYACAAGSAFLAG